MQYFYENEDCFDKCEHSYCTYQEYDTGYAEFECDLTGKYCDPDKCPFSFKYIVE